MFQEDRVVGVAFQGQPGLENTGFFIPPPVISHFLKDVSDGKYDGFPQAGAMVVACQNPAYRSYLQLPDDNFGARIDSLIPQTGADKYLKPDDVLLKVGDFRIADDGTILYHGNRVSAAMAFQTAQKGETVNVQIWRDGKPMDLSFPLNVYEADRAAGFQYEAPPRYFVYGGLVFTPLSLDYLRTLGRGSPDSSAETLFYELYYHRLEHPETVRKEPIVIATVLASAVNANVAIRARSLVDKINGVRIEKLDDAIAAFEKGTNTFDMIEFLPHANIECLDHAEAEKANGAILKTYGLASDRRL